MPISGPHIVFTRKILLFLLLGLVASNAVFFNVVERSLGRSYYNAFYILQYTRDTAWKDALVIDSVLLAMVAIIVWLATLLMSHRISGPVYRFRVSADSFADGHLNFNMRLREKDEMKDVAAAMDNAIGAHRQRFFELREISQGMSESAGALEDTLGSSGKVDGAGLEEIADGSRKLKETLSFFKT